MKAKQILSSALLFLTLLGKTHGEVIEVPSSGIRSIGRAITRAQPGDTILVSRGTYEEQIFIPQGVTIISREPHRATLDGGGRGTVVTMSPGSAIEGFVIKNGTIGVFSKGDGAAIRNCHIIQNWMTGIMTVRHFPIVEDNLIAFNRSSGIVGWDSRSTRGEASYNTIAYNGGFGLFLGGSSNVTFRNNVVAYNQKFGLKMSNESSESTIVSNNFYENLRQLYEFPRGNYSFDPNFRAARTLMDFRPARGCCTIKSTSGTDLGIRFTE